LIQTYLFTPKYDIIYFTPKYARSKIGYSLVYSISQKHDMVKKSSPTVIVQKKKEGQQTEKKGFIYV